MILFNKIIKNIPSQSMPQEFISFEDRDLLWISNQAKHLIIKKMLGTKITPHMKKAINLL